MRATCPSCHAVYSLADDLLGKKVRCKKCDGIILVVESSPNITRSRSDGGLEPPAPRRRKRAEVDLPQAGSNSRGLLIGLIAGGAGVLLVCGGIIVAGVLLLTGRSGNNPPGFVVDAEDGWPSIGLPPPPDSAILHVAGVADENTREAVSDRLEALSREGHFSVNPQRQGDRMTILVVNVEDVEAFSRKLDFGTVNSVNGRTITITATKVEGPPPNADAVTRMLFRLKSPDPHKRREAVRKLKETLPDERRAEVVKALEPLLNDADFFTRRDVIAALGVWGTKDTVPILLKAMREKETRGEAMKALGRLKDERAAEPLAERLEELFDRHDAEEALKSMGPIAEKAVLARLNHHDFQLRITVCEVLAAIGTKQSIAPLEKVIDAGKDIGSGEAFIVGHRAKEALKAVKARQ
jgi:predicted Zn finger-like uncharacterized protein